MIPNSATLHIVWFGASQRHYPGLSSTVSFSPPNYPSNFLQAPACLYPWVYLYLHVLACLSTCLSLLACLSPLCFIFLPISFYTYTYTSPLACLSVLVYLCVPVYPYTCLRLLVSLFVCMSVSLPSLLCRLASVINCSVTPLIQS